MSIFKQDKLITLKEASEISGYAPDYLGQLIRQGKIYGKQVYFNVAWMTTESAVKKYLNEKDDKQTENSFLKIPRVFFRKFRLEFESFRLLRVALYGTILLSIILSVALFYVFSVSLDRKLQQNALERAETTDNAK